MSYSLVNSYTLINESDGERIPLDKRTDEKDLGIWFTSTLSSSSLLKELQIYKSTITAFIVQNLCSPSP